MAKATFWTETDVEARKCGEQTGLDTLVVKLKGIDGGPHKQWSMWFNSKQREEPYQGLTYTVITKRLVSSSETVNRWCMVVVSSCREMLG